LTLALGGDIINVYNVFTKNEFYHDGRARGLSQKFFEAKP